MNPGFFMECIEFKRQQKTQIELIWVFLIESQKNLGFVQHFLDGFYRALHIRDSHINVGWRIAQGNVHGVDTNDRSV